MDAENKQSKYNVGDILIHRCYDGAQASLVVDEIKQDEYGRFIYYCHHSESCASFIYEDDVVEVLSKDSDKYKRYQLYLELKKEFGV